MIFDMSAWRRRAIDTFPNLRSDLENRRFTIYQLFFDLLPMAREAHRRRDEEVLRKVYGFAEWCMDQRAKDLWNAAGVAFYEHLLDEGGIRKDVLRWIPVRIREEVRGLWEWRLGAKEVAQILGESR